MGPSVVSRLSDVPVELAGSRTFLTVAPKDQRIQRHWQSISMFVIADTACLAHKTIELIGAKLIPAKECPERLVNILDKLEGSGLHELRLKHTDPLESHKILQTDMRDPPYYPENYNYRCMKLILNSHNEGYIRHLLTVHNRWVEAGLIEKDESILPECFRVPSVAKEFKDEEDGNPHVHQFEGMNVIDLSFGDDRPKDIYAQTGYYAFDMSTGICKDTWSATFASALLAYDAVCVARGVYDKQLKVKYIPEDQAPKTVLALCRPPGHHCNLQMAGGYCYVNNAVIAAQAFFKYHVRNGGALEIPNIAILDLDFHHGNGTQDAFYEQGILYVSIHGEDEYPYYTGSVDEVGAGHGKGFNCNLPLKAGSTAEQYLEKVDEAVHRLRKFKPDYLVISLGFDTFNTDPLGSFKLETPDYETIAAKVRQNSGLQNVSAVILLEGGYVVEHLGDNMLSFLKGWGA